MKNLSLEEHFLVLTFFISSLILNFDALYKKLRNQTYTATYINDVVVSEIKLGLSLGPPNMVVEPS